MNALRLVLIKSQLKLLIKSIRFTFAGIHVCGYRIGADAQRQATSDGVELFRQACAGMYSRRLFGYFVDLFGCLLFVVCCSHILFLFLFLFLLFGGRF